MSLFNIVRHERHTHDHHVSVTEKRAPTDESVRLLREMEQAAKEQVLKSVRVQDCAIDCVVHHMKSAINATDEFAVVYSVNGQRAQVRTSLNDWESPEEKAKKVMNDLANDIAITLLRGPFGKVFKEL